MRRDIPGGFDAVGVSKYFGILFAQDALDFVCRPDIENALTGVRLSRSKLAIGIFGRREASAWLLHFAHREIQNIARSIRIELFMRNLVSLRKGDGKLRLVIQHLLEMRDEPSLPCRIPMKSSAKLIVDSPSLHGTQRVERHLKNLALPCAGIVAKQEAQRHGARKFWR